MRSIGVLDQIEDFWPQIDIAINPVRFGSGLKIKNVEALAYGRALLTTSTGAEGLEAAGEAGIAIEDDATGWIRRLSEWIEMPHMIAERGQAGRAFASAHLSREAAFRPFGALLDQYVRAPRDTPAKSSGDLTAAAPTLSRTLIKQREKILILCSQAGFEALAGPVPDKRRDQFVFLKPDRDKAIRNALADCRLVISKNYPRPDLNHWIFKARRAAVPTLLLVDGPLEWANVYSNPSLQRPGAEGARSLFAPIVHDAVASIGAAQSSWIDSQNPDRGLLLIEYANRRIKTPPLKDQELEFDFLLTTAKTASFSDSERAELGSALKCCAEALRPYGARLLVRLFDAALEARVRALLPLARFETKGSFASALARTACVVGTPSSVLLEAMHHKKPTATLLFRHHPLFYQTGWQFDPQNADPNDFAAMLSRDEGPMQIQEQTLTQNLSDQDFYEGALGKATLERLTAPRPLDEADLDFEDHVRTWEKQSRMRLTTRLRHFAAGLGLR